MSMLMSALAGSNMIYGLGMIDLGMKLDYAQLVVDNEIARMVRRVLHGIPVCDDTMAVDLILSVGAGGHFLAEEHTVANMRHEQSRTRLFDRNTYGAWAAAGKKDLATRALEETRRILATHTPTPLSPKVSERLRGIVLDAAEAWGIKLTEHIW